MEKANFYAPFPVYDTEDVKSFKKGINKMKEDLEKVECCESCKSLFLVEDEFNNIWCGKCNSVNRIEFVKNINLYLKKYGDIWT